MERYPRTKKYYILLISCIGLMFLVMIVYMVITENFIVLSTKTRMAILAVLLLSIVGVMFFLALKYEKYARPEKKLIFEVFDQGMETTSMAMADALHNLVFKVWNTKSNKDGTHESSGTYYDGRRGGLSPEQFKKVMDKTQIIESIALYELRDKRKVLAIRYDDGKLTEAFCSSPEAEILAKRFSLE